MNKWKLICYFDVWFNEEEGYWVNDQCTIGDVFSLPKDASDRDIFDYLRGIVGFFKPEEEFEDYKFEGDDESIEISTEKDGYIFPIGRLVRERKFENE